jgi:hypothetical protein
VQHLALQVHGEPPDALLLMQMMRRSRNSPRSFLVCFTLLLPRLSSNVLQATSSR